MSNHQRQAQRTRDLLEQALIDLVGERGYDSITVQDIADRANVGRTTFYLHYTSKDELFLSCHESIVSAFDAALFSPQTLTREQLLASDPPPGLIAAFRHLDEARAHMLPVFQSQDGAVLMRHIRDRSARHIEASLRAAFSPHDCCMPLDLLSTYLAGAQISLVHWWLEKHQPHTPEAMAQTFHRLQRAAISEAFGLAADEMTYPKP